MPSGPPVALGGGLSVDVPAATRVKLDAALAQAAGSAERGADLADVLAGLFVVHAGHDPALLAALARYALTRAPAQEYAIGEAVRLARAAAADPALPRTGADALGSGLVLGEAAGADAVGRGELSLAEAGLTPAPSADSPLAGGPPLDLGELPIPVDADAQPLETQPALRPDPRGTPGRGASRYPGAGELGDTYRSGAARGGRGGVAWSAGAAGGRQVTLSPGGGAGGLAGSAAEREADLAGMEETESAIREIFADLLDDTAPPPSGGAASPVLP